MTAAEETNGVEWDTYVSTHHQGTADHAWGWQQIFADVFGHRSHYLTARRDGRIVGVLPLVAFESRLFGKFIASVPFLNYGGVLADDDSARVTLVAKARQIAAEFGASHVELRHVGRQLPDLPYRQHKLQLTRALPSSTEELWAGIDKKVRNLVRKAQKAELEVRVGGSELVAPFYEVFSRNMRDLGTPVYSRRLFDAVLQQFPTARVHLVQLGPVPVAASITLQQNSTVLVPWASSLREYRQHVPNMLLYWAMLGHAVTGGAQHFDFGRSSPGSGTHQFKLQWGATATPLHWEYVLLTRAEPPDQGPTNPRFQMAVEMWKKLPLAITNRVGPMIVRNIP